jgi:hypothetical protein
MPEPSAAVSLKTVGRLPTTSTSMPRPEPPPVTNAVRPDKLVAAAAAEFSTMPVTLGAAISVMVKDGVQTMHRRDQLA